MDRSGKNPTDKFTGFSVIDKIFYTPHPVFPIPGRLGLKEGETRNRKLYFLPCSVRCLSTYVTSFRSPSQHTYVTYPIKGRKFFEYFYYILLLLCKNFSF